MRNKNVANDQKKKRKKNKKRFKFLNYFKLLENKRYNLSFIMKSVYGITQRHLIFRFIKAIVSSFSPNKSHK